jgi:FkbM family methyltransferase
MPSPLRRLRRPGLADPYMTPSYAQEGEDAVLARLVDDRRDGFYVDVGAYHPRRFSNTYAFYLRGWRGINIDPDERAIAQFDRKRPGDVNVAIGIASMPGTATLYVFAEPALNTLDERLARERAASPDCPLAGTREVEVRRLDDVLDELLPPGRRIDFLSVDAEGRDLDVLASNDWARFRPALVLAESLGAELLEAAVGDAATAFLRGRGYVAVAKTLHTLVFRDESARGHAGA